MAQPRQPGGRGGEGEMVESGNCEGVVRRIPEMVISECKGDRVARW